MDNLQIKNKATLQVNNESSDEDISNNTMRINNINNVGLTWVEKYRPRTLSEIMVNPCTNNKIKNIIDTQNMPHVILVGPPGTGKTSSLFLIARSLLGKHYRNGVLELNASDDRGVKALEPIIYFCKKKLDLSPDAKTGRTYSKHKIVLLDEADNMTDKAQRLIKTLMEEYGHSTRFALTCNNSSDIIEGIQSRCIIFRYQKMDDEQILTNMKKICSLEDVEYTGKGLSCILFSSQGDMRMAINNLQTIATSFSKVTINNVLKICDSPPPATIKNIFIECHNHEFVKALGILDNLVGRGYSNSDIIDSMLEILKTVKVIKIKELNECTKVKYSYDIGKTAVNISKGIDTQVQMTSLIAKLCFLSTCDGNNKSCCGYNVNTNDMKLGDNYCKNKKCCGKDNMFECCWKDVRMEAVINF